MMKRSLHRLSAAHLHRKPDGFHADDGGRYLRVRSKARVWVVRYQRSGRLRHMGLGSLNDLPLAEARAVAAEARKLLALGQDPLEDRRHAAASASRSKTFKEAAEAYIADHETAWGNVKHKTQWINTLAAYAHPIIGSLPVSGINTSLALKIIRPQWQTKTETASRVRQRIEAILGWATIHGYRTGDNPAA
jgi:Arm DNA-binding domain